MKIKDEGKRCLGYGGKSKPKQNKQWIRLQIRI